MELSTTIGIIMGVLAVGIGMVLKGASLSALFNPAAIMIIFVGTAATLFIAFPMNDLKKFPKLLKKLFKKEDTVSKPELVRFLKELTQTVRREGLLAIEEKVSNAKDPFLQLGLQLIVDGLDEEMAKDILLEEIEAMERRHRAGAAIFSQAGTYAPTLGVLGAVVGLVAALGNLSDIEKLGQSIAAAFIATLFGIFSGYVIWHPMANKLKRLSADEVELKTMMAEGVLSLSKGISPSTMEQKLLIFLSASEREAVRNGAVEGANESKQTRTA